MSASVSSTPLTLTVGLLKADPQNPRTIDAPALRGLGVSMETFGDLSSLVWNERTGNLVAGHQRMNRLKAAGAVEWVRDGDRGVIVHPKTGERFIIRIVNWDETTERMANLTANNSEIQGDFTDEAAEQLRALEDELNFKDLRLDELQAELDEALKAAEEDLRDGSTDPDDVPEPPDDPITQSGDLWILGEHRLLCGDSTQPEDVARLMGGESADCVFTSPPYGVGVDYDSYEDTIGNLRAMLRVLPGIWAKHIVRGGFAVVNFADIVAGREAAEIETVCEYPMALEYWPAFRAARWVLWSRRIWCKPNARTNAPWTANSNRGATDWEHVWTWKMGGDPILSRIPNSPIGWIDTTRGDGVDIGKETHGAGMPVALPLHMLPIHSRRGRVVFEPFTGTGTTMMAGEKLRRKVFGLDVSPRYCDIAVARWEAFTGRKAVRHAAAR